MQDLSAVHAAPAQLSTARRNRIGGTTSPIRLFTFATAFHTNIVFIHPPKEAGPFDS
jgi:hypothetical protein